MRGVSGGGAVKDVVREVWRSAESVKTDERRCLGSRRCGVSGL